MKKPGTASNFAEGDPKPDVLSKEVVQKMHNDSTLRMLVSGIASASRDTIIAHVLFSLPVVMEYTPIHFPFATNATFLGGKWYFSKEQAVQCDSKGPDVDGISDRLGRRWRGLIYTDRVVHNFGCHEHGRPGSDSQVGICEENGVLGIILGGRSGMG